MRTFGLPLISRPCLAAGILLASLVCSAQQPQESQSCSGDRAPAGAEKAQPAAMKKASFIAATANPTSHTIRLSWIESASPASTVAGYYIYRRETGLPCQSQPTGCVPLNPNKPVKGKGCTDYSVVPGHTYIYQAQTVGKNSLSSTYSNDATATAR